MNDQRLIHWLVGAVFTFSKNSDKCIESTCSNLLNESAMRNMH